MRFSSRTAFVRSAPAHERRLADREVEVVVVAHSFYEFVEFVRGNVAHESTLVADQMPVSAHEMKERLAVRLMHFLDETPFAERVKGSIHG